MCPMPEGTAEGTVTWRQLLAEDVPRLRAAGHEGADVEARRIVEEASGLEGAELALGLDEAVTEGRLAHHDDMVSRRVGGEPLQYVLGRWGFRHLDLAVDRRALIPRPETEQVVEVGLAELDRMDDGDHELVVVDLGTGTGAIALSIASERIRTRVWATDASDDAIALARANLAGIGRPAARVRIVPGSWYDALGDDLRGEVALVISNPPYVADDAPLPVEVVDWEPHAALRAGPDGLDDLHRIIDGAADWLMPGGALVVEIDPGQADAVSARARAAGLVDVVVVDDLSSRARAMRARRPA